MIVYTRFPDGKNDRDHRYHYVRWTKTRLLKSGFKKVCYFLFAWLVMVGSNKLLETKNYRPSAILFISAVYNQERVVNITDKLCTKQGNVGIKLGVYNQARVIMARIL